jgi:hypothetical protein
MLCGHLKHRKVGNLKGNKKAIVARENKLQFIHTKKKLSRLQAEGHGEAPA